MIQRQPNSFQVRLNGVMGLIIVIVFFVLLFFIARSIFQVLAWASPVLIIAALIVNYRTVVGFLRFLWDTLRKKPLMGILGILLTIVGFPIVCGFLLGKAFLDRKVRVYQKKIQTQREGELVDYEDVTDKPIKSDALELRKPVIEEKPANTYDQFFKEDSGDGD